MEDKTVIEKVVAQTEDLMNLLVEEGITVNNVEYLYKLVDIHKDLKNENYWKEKMSMRYRDSYGREAYGEGSYGRRMRDSRGRYMEGSYGENYGESYGKAEEMLDRMNESFGAYSEGKYTYGRGSYGHEEKTMKSLDHMLKSTVSFIEMLKKDAGSQEEVELIKKYTRQISEM